MGVQLLFVVNKAGGLIFVRAFQDNAPRLTQNDYLHLASTFHGMQLLVKELSPELPKYGAGGVEILETSAYVLQAFHSPTGVEFFVTADPKTERLVDFLKDVYVIYADYVMKNPFYELDMPIKCDRWELHLRDLVERYNRGHS